MPTVPFAVQPSNAGSPSTPLTCCQSLTSCMGRELLLEPFSTSVRLRRWGRAPFPAEYNLGPLLFALGFDELMKMPRIRMANLPVDTVIGKEVKFTPNAEVVRDQVRGQPSHRGVLELELKLIQTRMIQKPLQPHNFIAEPRTRFNN